MTLRTSRYRFRNLKDNWLLIADDDGTKLWLDHERDSINLLKTCLIILISTREKRWGWSVRLKKVSFVTEPQVTTASRCLNENKYALSLDDVAENTQTAMQSKWLPTQELGLLTVVSARTFRKRESLGNGSISSARAVNGSPSWNLPPRTLGVWSGMSLLLQRFSCA
jgi:hypothetical protein